MPPPPPPPPPPPASISTPTPTTPQLTTHDLYRAKRTPTPQQTSHDLYRAKRALRQQRHTLISSGDFLGVTGVNPYTGEPDVITPPTSSDDAVVTSSSSAAAAAAAAVSAGSRLVEYQPEWALGNLVAIPVDLRRLSEDCRVRRMSTGRVLELDDLESWAGSQLHDLDSPHRQTDVIVKAGSREMVHGRDQGLQSVCTRTTTTTGFGHGRPRRRIAALPFGAMLDGSYDAPPRRQALMPRARSRSISPLSSATTPRSTCSDRPASPGRMQLSVWRNVSSRGLPMTTPASVRKKVGIGPLRASPIPRPPLEHEADSDTTSSSTDHETTAPAREKGSARPRQPTAGDENRPPQQQDWAMRKTMRKPPSSSSGPEDDAGTRRLSRTSTRTSTSPVARRWSPRTTPRPDQAETIARGAARTAFVHHGVPRGITATVLMGGSVRPVSARDPGSHHPHGAGAAGTRAKAAAKPGVAAGTGREQGGKKGKGEQKGKEQRKGEQKGNEKGKAAKGETTGNLEVRHWLRSAMVMLARVVGAYWQVVSPVFDGDSELRKRVDRAQATRGDVVVCVLAVVFLFLVVSGGVWAVRGIVWMVRLLGGLGEVLKAVAGLRD
ncbi:hypothetical protein C8A01DRAFT_20432 [Parachaetomium inaequale]|uniref:Uncharacterized protein n=1 Tax=Parachaetomium inaequale TaxID=2588326 RepID=A0AAN6P6G0_9PEZI|nr:hypothetical protein C8A01DRAFT_20432 [Parachaetomium inaequale]